MILAVLATLGAGVVAFVLYPVFAQDRSSGTGDLSEPDQVARELLELEEKKARLYAAISDLDFEREAGKVSPADHEAARNDYLQQVAAVLARMDALAPAKGKKKAAEPPEPARQCGSCGRPTPSPAKFCIHCGAPLEAAGSTCVRCGEKLPAGARFCMSCGARAAAG